MSEADPFGPDDPLAALPPPERVNYATGVLLDAEDFRDEQTYHRARLANLLRALAGFGTLAGLRVTRPEDDDPERELSVAPGFAIDRLGRLVEVSAPQCIRLSRWFAAQPTALLRAALQSGPPKAVVVDVFLSTRDCARGKTPAFATGPFDALDAVVPARLAESALLEIIPRTEASPIPAPQNFWPVSAATDAEKLEAVLGSYEKGNGAVGETFDPLQEHVVGQDALAVLLARVSIPVSLSDGAGADVRPQLDLLSPVVVDNSIRPFVFLAGKWFGRAIPAEPLVQP
jgi:hypothetical protein